MRWRSVVGWSAVGVGVLVLLALVTGYAILKSPQFHRYVLAKIVEQVDQSTGGQTQIQGYDLSLTALSANMYGIQVRGKEGSDRSPLFQVDRIHAAMKIVSLLGGDFGIRDITITHPVVHLWIDKNGATNIPEPKTPKQSNSSFNLFKTVIDHAQLDNGQIYLNDHQIPLDASVYDLGVNVDFNSLPARYSGFLRYRNGQLKYAGLSAFPHSLDFQFSATPSQLSAKPLEVSVGSSRIVFRGEITNYANPAVDGSYSILVHGDDFSDLLSGVRASGNVGVSGTLHYQSAPDQPLLRAVVLDGNIDSAAMRIRSPQADLNLQQINGKFLLKNANLQVQGASIDLLNGQLAADLNMQHLDATPVAKLHASLRQISLAAAKAAIRNPSWRQVAVSGTLAGGLDGSWKGSPKNIRLHSDLVLRSDVSPSGQRAIPVNGDIHADYDGVHNMLTLQRTSLQSGTNTVVAQGTIGQRSTLSIQTRARELNQLAVLVAQLRGGNPIDVRGSAALDATITGSLAAPNVSAQLSTQDLAVQGTQWKTLQLRLLANPSQIAVQNGTLVNAQRGQAKFSGTVGLHQWSFTETSPIQVSISARQLSIKQLQDLAGQDFPVTGELYVNASFHGSQMDPLGDGTIRLEKAQAYNEQLQNFIVQFNAANRTIHSTLDVAIPAGSANAQLAFVPKTKSYQLQFRTAGITLDQLAAVKTKNLGVVGIVTASATGAGTLDNPQLSASMDASKVEFKQTAITGINARLNVANHRADLTLKSGVAQASIQAKATVHLAGGYDTVANIDTSAFPLNPILAAYVPSIPEGFEGRTEFHASLKGPLKDKARLEAHLTVPTLSAKYEELQIANAGPIHMDFIRSVATIQPSELRGTDTSLKFQGRIPVTNPNAATVAASGNINLRLVRLFAPDVRTAGNVTLDLRANNGGGLSGIEGQVRIQNAGFSSTTFPVGVDRMNGTLNIQKDHVQISNFDGQVGGGKLQLGGSVTYKPSVQFNLSITGNSMRLRYPEGLRSVLSSNITLTGTMQEALLGGRVLIDSLSFTPDFDLANFANQFSGPSVPSAGESFADKIKMNVAVQSAGSFRATSSQVSIEGQANLQVIGTASNPVIVGRMDLTSGELFYAKKRYELQRGIINFANPARTEPVLNVQVATTVQQYNLTLGLRGPIDRLQINYSSDPPLASADIIYLIAFGQTTGEGTPGNMSANSFLAQGVSTGLNKGVSKLSGLSSIQIDPLLSSNNQNPSARVAVQQRVTKNLLFTFSTGVTNPQSEVVQGEYQINRRWSVSATRDELGGVAFDARFHTNF